MAAPLRDDRTARSLPESQSDFDFTYRIRCVCEDMVARLPQLAHIEMEQVAVSFCQTRKNVRHGLQAALTPMRFEEGKREIVRKGQRWRVQQIRNSQGQEVLYLLSFYMPRFQNQPFREKLVTILHELWHISPRFDGDLRRLGGRCYVHSTSEKAYDAAMAVLAEDWFSQNPPPAIYDFLKMSFTELQKNFGGVRGLQISAPKLIRCD